MTKNAFTYCNNLLTAEALPLLEIAEEIDTPFFCESTKQLQTNYRDLAKSFSNVATCVHYAVGTNANMAVIKILSDCGAGGEIATVGELERALEGGLTPDKIVLSGTAKTRDDIVAALLANVAAVYVSSASDLSLVDQVAFCLGKKAPILLQIDTSEDGAGRNGIVLTQMNTIIEMLANMDNCVVKGVAACCPDEVSCDRLGVVIAHLRNSGYAIGHLSLKGQVDCAPCEEREDALGGYLRRLYDNVARQGCLMTHSYGRRLVAEAGVLVSQIVHLRQDGDHMALFIDAGVNEATLPSGAHKHEILALRQESNGACKTFSVYGPLGGMADCFGEYQLPASTNVGDFLAIMQAGAIGRTAPSSTSAQAMIPEILVSAAQYAVIRRRLAVAEQLEWETYPEWMVKDRVA
jgi:diaminopimelate decarboxylase